MFYTTAPPPPTFSCMTRSIRSFPSGLISLRISDMMMSIPFDSCDAIAFCVCVFVHEHICLQSWKLGKNKLMAILQNLICKKPLYSQVKIVTSLIKQTAFYLTTSLYSYGIHLIFCKLHLQLFSVSAYREIIIWPQKTNL